MSEMSQIDIEFEGLKRRIVGLEEVGLKRDARIAKLEQQVELDGMRQDLLRGMVKDLIDICGQK